MLASDRAYRRGKSLTGLMADADGRIFLRNRGIFSDVREFIDRLEPPESTALTKVFGADLCVKPVYAAQQIYADYRWSVVSKLLTLNALGEMAEVLPCVLWSDIDRCGSDKLSTGFVWPLDESKPGVHLVTKRARNAETRFALVDRVRLCDAADRLERSLTDVAPDSREACRARDRFRPIRDILLGDDFTTLRDVNGALTAYLLENHLGLTPRWRYMSELLELEVVKREVEFAVNNLDAFRAIYNGGVRTLQEEGLDPQVPPRAADELPLFYSPPADGRRLRLRREVSTAGIHYATARTESGQIHRFPLGTGPLSIDAVIRSRRWSPDVSLPLFLSGLLSGAVVGRSSALYCLVLNEVREKLFGRRAIPMLVPDAALNPADYGFQRDSILYSYLLDDGRTAG